MSFVDSTTLSVCRNQRIPSHRVFKDLAQRGKTSMGWFYGFKIEYSPHRSMTGFMTNVLSALIAYS